MSTKGNVCACKQLDLKTSSEERGLGKITTVRGNMVNECACFFFLQEIR